MGAPLQLICPCHPLVPFFLDYVGVDPRVYPDFGVGPYLDALWGIGVSFRSSEYPNSHGDAMGYYVAAPSRRQIGS